MADGHAITKSLPATSSTQESVWPTFAPNSFGEIVRSGRAYSKHLRNSATEMSRISCGGRIVSADEIARSAEIRNRAKWKTIRWGEKRNTGITIEPEDAFQEGLLLFLSGPYEWAFLNETALGAALGAYGFFEVLRKGRAGHTVALSEWHNPNLRSEPRDREMSIFDVIPSLDTAESRVRLREIQQMANSLPAAEQYLVQMVLDGATPLEMVKESGMRALDVMRTHKALQEKFMRLA